MSKAFASQSDLADKRVTFTELAPGAYAYTTEGDPNTGVIVGDDGVMVIDTQATPAMAADVIRRIHEITEKPVKYVVLTHYHAVRVLGASAYGAPVTVASRGTYELIKERGEQDWKSEVGRFPRLFRSAESIPGLTWPDVVFDERVTLRLGGLEVEVMHLGRGHSKGDTVVWLPERRVLYSGDLVEFGATPYTGDAYFRDWPATLDRVRALRPAALVPGRGDALTAPADCERAIDGTQAFLTELYAAVSAGRAKGWDLKQVYDATYAALKPRFGDWVIFDHCLPFDVSRAYDEAGGIEHPRIWTAERDVDMWKALEGASP